MSLKIAERLLQQETLTTGIHCGQSSATVDLLPTYSLKQEAGATLDWSLLCGSLCGDGSISVGAT